MTKPLEVVDLFCGAGGEATGLEWAYQRRSLDIHVHAVNHWERALETHAQNHPKAEHYHSGVDDLDPTRVVPGGKVALLWASPPCTHHSRARGGKPKCDQSRASAWSVLNWLQNLYVERVIVENVPEFADWGPLDENGDPIPEAKGSLFKAWIRMLQALEYHVEARVLNAADYGAPTTRYRLFIQAVKRRSGKRIVWPQPVFWSQDRLADLFHPVPLPTWRSAGSIVDWSVPGKSIFDRPKPLCDATLRRIEVGIRRYWGKWAEPFIVVLRGTSNVARLDQPLATVTAGGGHFGLVEPFVCRYNGGENRVHGMDEPLPVVDCGNRYGIVAPSFICQSEHGLRVTSSEEPMPTITTSSRGFSIVSPLVCPIDNRSQKGGCRPSDEPLSTVTTEARHALVEPFILHQMSPGRSRGVSEPMPSVTTHSGHALVVPYYGRCASSGADEPLPTVTTKDRFGLLTGDQVTLDIRFRMFLPKELAGAQGFPSDYVFTGNWSEKVKQIGNAVCPPAAFAMVDANEGEVQLWT